MSTALRLLVLGAGAVVREYYMPALDMLGLAGEARVIDRAPGVLEALGRRWPGAITERADFRRILDQPELAELFDAAVVALPTSLHEEATDLALRRGLHVLCEKPLALSRDACLRLADRAEAADRLLAVSMVRRLLPSIAAVRHALSSGLIGELLALDFEDGDPYAWLSNSGDFFRKENGGVLADMGVHYLDLADEFAGTLVPSKYVDDFAGGVEANALLELQSERGLPVRIALSRTRPLRNTLIFRGSRGELVVTKGVDGSCLWRLHEPGAGVTLSPERPFSGGNWRPVLDSCFAQQLHEFQEAIGDGASPRVGPRDAARVISAIEWAYGQRRAPVRPVGPRSVRQAAGLGDGAVFVSGGTGFIGANLIRRLHEDGVEAVVAPVRAYRTCAPIARFPVSMPHVDLLSYEQVRAALKGVRWVFHLAYGSGGITVDGTRNVVEGAIAEGCEAVVALSSMYVFGRPHGATVDESWPYRPVGGEYGKSKARMERWCRERSASSGKTRIVVLNPSCVYGPGGKTYSELPVRLTSEGMFCWIDGGMGVANYTFVENLIDAMILAATQEPAHGERFIVNDGCVSWRAFLGPLLGRLGEDVPSFTWRELTALNRRAKRRRLLEGVRGIASDPRLADAMRNVPLLGGALRLAARHAPATLEAARAWRAHTAARVGSVPGVSVPPSWLSDLFGPTNTRFSAAKASQVLGWAPRIDLERGQQLTVSWLRDIGLL